MKECSHVAKNGTNDYHKYKYVTAADVLEKVNSALTFGRFLCLDCQRQKQSVA